MILNQIFSIIAFCIIFIVAIVYLRPLRMHKKLKYSTLTLKVSYLVYLLFAMYVAYMFMFYRNKTLFTNMDTVTSSVVYLILGLLIIGYIIPNVGILIRRRVKNRESYNILLSFVNIGYIAFYLLLLYVTNWGVKITFIE
jgi:hypothetical protein